MVVLVLTSHGTKLGRKKEMFKITRPETEFQEELFAAETVEEIIMESTGSISTEAIKLASRYAIPILFVYGNEPIACLTPFASHGTVRVRRAQIKAYETKIGVRFCKEIIKTATDNKIKIIKEMVRVRKLDKNVAGNIKNEIRKMEDLKAQLKEIKKEKIDECREEIFTKESEITKTYYSCLQKMLSKEINFNGRTRRPPKDPVNVLLSYGYAVLTAQIYKSVIIAGLEPYAGFLHTDRAGKVSFVLDLIEIFRQPVVDRLVLTLVEKKMIKKEDFEKNEENSGLRMKEKTKKKFLEYLFEKIRTENINYKGKKTSYQRIFVDQARKAGEFFINKVNYEPYSIKK